MTAAIRPPWKAAGTAVLRQAGLAALAVVAAILMRKLFLGALGTRIVWVTFYPAVMIAALYGGVQVGLAAAVLSCLCVVHGWFLLSPSPFLRDQGDLVGMAAFLVNCAMIALVAEHSRRSRARAETAQAQAEAARTQAEAANRAKGAFLAHMSHELRTPLNAVLGYASMARELPDQPEEGRRQLAIVHRSAEHLLALINDMLDMARIESGKAVRDLACFNLPAVLAETAEMLRNQAETKGLTLQVTFSPGLPRQVRSDERKLRQILLNLLGNAIKYTPTGKITLGAATFDAGDAGGCWLRLVIEDSGPGIAWEDRERIFQPFVRLEHHAATGGTGLGLTLARQHTEVLGGSLVLENPAGGGARFILKLPLDPAPEGFPEAAGGQLGWATRLAPGQAPCRILVVEDLEENRSLLREFLERAGFEVAVAQDGAEGVARFASFRPHLVWMDDRMPVLDGREAARQIRALDGGRDTRIIGLSASVFEEDRQGMLAAGMDGFLRKPFLAADLLGALQRHLGVRFSPAGREAGPAGSPEPAAGLDLSSLPEPLKQRLREALLRLDRSGLARLSREVAQASPAQGHGLAALVANFQYSRVLQSLDLDAEAPS